MNLLLDLGNTRLKWGLHDGAAWLERGAADYDRLDGFAERVGAASGLVRAVGTNVAGRAAAATVAARLPTGLPLEWSRPSRAQCGVHNGYLDEKQLGADRWAALIGARHAHAGETLVVMAGTATTVDLLGADGRFRGGLILPGLGLMRRSLARDTADLPFADGAYEAFPRRTEDAIVSGCLEAQIGAIERLFARLEADAERLCLLGGGAAPAIAPWLSIPFRQVDNLVLDGLAQIAAERANIST
ncbi:MAG: type III pantothenate kinase [Rhodocyclaceae bacterium]|nr:type III pantothenate kinase [Rhodocyclaceae bacterium]